MMCNVTKERRVLKSEQAWFERMLILGGQRALDRSLVNWTISETKKQI